MKENVPKRPQPFPLQPPPNLVQVCARSEGFDTLFNGTFDWRMPLALAQWEWMGFARHIGMLLLCLRFCAGALGQDAAEAEAFTRLSKTFADKFYELARQSSAEFSAKYPASTRLPEAQLIQIQSLNQLRSHDAVIELVDRTLNSAGSLAGDYLFWKADSLFEKGSFELAAPVYEQILKQFPESPFRLSASLNRARCAFRLRDLPKTIELLSSPEGEFQKAAAAAPAAPQVHAGLLLLADAHLANGQGAEATRVLEGLGTPPPPPEVEWERNFQLARILLADSKGEAALAALTNSITAADLARNAVFKAQSLNLQADVHKKLGQPELAMQIYDLLASATPMPADQKRLALLKLVESLTYQGRLTNALARMESFIGENPADPASDFLHLKAGEMWLNRYNEMLEASGRPPPASLIAAVTNSLGLSRYHFAQILSRFTNSSHLGKSQLNLGWTLWEEGVLFGATNRFADSEQAFRAAVDRLPRSEDQALARFKLAESQARLGKHSEAIAQFAEVVSGYADIPQARTNLFPKAQVAMIRAAVALGKFDLAETILGQLRAAFDQSPSAEEGIAVLAQALADAGEGARARALIQQFIEAHPNSSALPDLRLTEARTFAVERDWPQAVAHYNRWIGVHTNHALYPEVNFDRAWLSFEAGDELAAHGLFTNFVSRFASNRFAPAAQLWVGDYFFRLENWQEAERAYQQVFTPAAWAGSRFAAQARLMAARSAFFRQAFPEAKAHLAGLLADPACPPDLKPEALFAMGDVLMEQRAAGTNVVANFLEAARVFDSIHQQYPGTVRGALALGKKGDCLLQASAEIPASLDEAEAAYKALLATPVPGLPQAAVNQADFGLALILEKRASAKDNPERRQLLQLALKHLLGVAYDSEGGGGRGADPVWRKRAALAAGRIAETLGDTEAAITLYRRLQRELPALRPVWESKVQLLLPTVGAVKG